VEHCSGTARGRIYLSEGETSGKDLTRPFAVSSGDGFPESSKKSSWSIWVTVRAWRGEDGSHMEVWDGSRFVDDDSGFAI